MKNKKFKEAKKVIGIFLSIMLICSLIPQTVHAAGMSVVNNGDSSITISVNYGGYAGYLASYMTEAEYSLLSPRLPGEVGHEYTGATYTGMKGDIMTASTISANGYGGLLGNPSGAFVKGSVVYVLVFILSEDTVAEKFTIVSYHTAAITIGDAPQTVAGSYAHNTHSYEWVTITEPSLTQDGLEQYACSCGNVQLTQPIPAATVYIKGLYGAVKNASPDAAVNYNAGKWTGISDYVIKKLAERPDVTTQITFEHKNASYSFTIPAGTSFESLLNDNENYYGFFTYCELLGIPVTQL